MELKISIIIPKGKSLSKEKVCSADRVVTGHRLIKNYKSSGKQETRKSIICGGLSYYQKHESRARLDRSVIEGCQRTTFQTAPD